MFCIAAGPIIFLRIDLWPPLRAWFPCACPRSCGGHVPAPLSNILKLQAARVKEGFLVAVMSALRLAYLAMLVTIAFQTKAPTFACVEFSFNRSNQPSVTTDGLLQPTEPTPYTTSGFELIQALFYPVFLLAGRYYPTPSITYDSHPSSIPSLIIINSPHLISPLFSLTFLLFRCSIWSTRMA